MGIKNSRVYEEIVAGEYHIHNIKKCLFSGNTKYHNAKVVEFEASGLALLLDERIQSCEIDEFVYNEAAVHPALLLHPNPKRVLCLAGGMGGIVREVVKHKNIKEIVVMDEDPEVSKIISEFLPHMKLQNNEDDRLSVLFGSCLEYLESCETFDVIILDSPDSFSDSPYAALFTEESYNLIMEALNPNGILAIQLGAVHPATMSAFFDKKCALSKKFSFVAPYHVEVHSLGTSWGFALASKYKYKLDNNIIAGIKNNPLINSLSFFDYIAYKRMFLWPKHLKK